MPARGPAIPLGLRRRFALTASALIVVLVCDVVVLATQARSGDRCVTGYWHFTRKEFIGSTIEVQLRTCLHLSSRTRTATVTTRARARRSGDLNLEPVLRRAYVHVAVTSSTAHADMTCAFPALVSVTGLQALARQKRGGEFAGYGTVTCSVSAPAGTRRVTAASNPLVDVVDDGFDLLGNPYTFSG